MSATTISAGTTSHNLRLTDGETALVEGTAISTSILSGGEEYVAAGGFAYGAQIANGGAEILSGSGTDDVSTISSGGEEYVSGGTALGPTVQSAGLLYVVAGGAAVDAVLLSGGIGFVTSGGTTTGTQIDSGGIDGISGGIAYSARVSNGGFQLVFGGGTASATIVQAGGQEAIGSGGTLVSAIISGGGLTEIMANASAANTMINAGGTVLVDSGGVVVSSVIARSGVEIVQSGGTDGGATVAAGGYLVVLPGATVQNITGTATSTGVVLVQPDAPATVYAASAFKTMVPEDGSEYVLAGGVAISTTVSGGFSFGVVSVYSGGNTLGTRIDSGGQEYVMAGGTASGSLVASAGYQYVSGGTAYATTLAEGTLYLIGGATSGAVLSGGSREFVESGGAAVRTVVQAGSDELVVSGGIAYQTSISSSAFEYVDSTGITSNTVIDGGTLVLSRGSTAVGSIVFAGGVLDIESSQMPAAVISGFTPGDTIRLTALSYAASDTVTVKPGGIAINTSGGLYTLNIAGVSAGFALSDVNGDVELTVPCFAAGTRILTPCGERRVEALRVGDAVITLGGVEARIVWIGHRSIALRRHRQPGLAQPVRIAAGAFGEGRPARDLILSPDHAVFYEGVLIPAKALVNGVNITQLSLAEVEYYHIEMARHAVMFAEGLAVESYLDTGNRYEFENGGVVMSLHPDFAQNLRQQNSCAPFMENGPVVVALRQSVARRGLLFQAASTSRSIMAPSCSRATARS